MKVKHMPLQERDSVLLLYSEKRGTVKYGDERTDQGQKKQADQEK